MKKKIDQSVEKFRDLKEKFHSILESLGVDEENIDEYEIYLGGKIREELSRIEGRISSIEEDLGEVDKSKLEVYEERERELRKKLENMEKEFKDLSEMIGEKKRELEELRKAVERLRILEKEINEREKDSRLIEGIKNSLRKDSLGDFLIQAVFEPVIEMASLRVKNVMAGKFSLKLSGSRLSVIDRDGRDVDVNSLSGGEKTIVALMLVLSISETLSGGIDLFFIDEGFSALDGNNRESVAEMLRNLEEKEKTVMFITHFEDLAERFENVIRFENGRIVTG